MTTLSIGKRLVPLEHVVLVEPFDPSTQTRMQTDKAYQTTVRRYWPKTSCDLRRGARLSPARRGWHRGQR
jgi:hypothetical protein